MSQVIERWMIGKKEWDAQRNSAFFIETLNRTDEFRVPVPGIEVDIVVLRDGTVTDCYADGRRGVPKSVQEEAENYLETDGPIVKHNGTFMQDAPEYDEVDRWIEVVVDDVTGEGVCELWEPEFNRFDICEAYCVLEWDYNVDGWVRERPRNQRCMEATSIQLARVQFKPGAGLCFDSLSPNGKAIYHQLEKRYGFK